MLRLHIEIKEAIERATNPERFTRPGTAVNAVSVRAHRNTPRSWCNAPANDDAQLGALLRLACELAEAQRDVIARATDVAQRIALARANTAPLEPTHLAAPFGDVACRAVGEVGPSSRRLGDVTCTACRDVVR